jgi:hypothetical protein
MGKYFLKAMLGSLFAFAICYPGFTKELDADRNPDNYEMTDFEYVVYAFSVATCGAMEGLVSMEEAKRIAVIQLNDEFKIPTWKVENIIKLKSFRQMMNHFVVDQHGGCKSFLKKIGVTPVKNN